MENEKKSTMLLDTFHDEGTDKFNLADTVATVTATTNIYRLSGNDITWYAVEDGLLASCPPFRAKNGSGRIWMVDAIRKVEPFSKYSEELWDEAITQSRIFLSFVLNGDMKFFAVTKEVSSDFGNLGIKGAVAQCASCNLLGLVAEQLVDKDVTLVIREIDGVEKVIALRSGKFAYIPQDDALNVASDVCEDGDIQMWSVTNFLTQVVYAFPQHTVTAKIGRKSADFLPYIRYFTSDRGDSSCKFELGWKVGNRNDIFLASGSNQVFRTHRSDWNDEIRNRLSTDAKKLKDKFTIAKERMDELMKITVLNENIERCVRNILMDTKITSKGTGAALVKHVADEFVGTDATAAEIILSMIEAQDTEKELIDLSDDARNKLAHSLGEAMYCRIRQYA